MVKISPLNKRLRQKGPQPGGASCTDCFRGRHRECEDGKGIFCNCWRAKHELNKEDLHQMPKSGTVRVGRKAPAKKKGGK